MVIENTISVGNLITIGSGIILWIITLVLAWSKFDTRMTMLEFRVTLIETTLEKIALILEKFTTSEKENVLLKTEVAALHANYTKLNDTVEELRRGKGWIQTGRYQGVDAEYPRTGNN